MTARDWTGLGFGDVPGRRLWAHLSEPVTVYRPDRGNPTGWVVATSTAEYASAYVGDWTRVTTTKTRYTFTGTEAEVLAEVRRWLEARESASTNPASGVSCG